MESLWTIWRRFDWAESQSKLVHIVSVYLKVNWLRLLVKLELLKLMVNDANYPINGIRGQIKGLLYCFISLYIYDYKLKSKCKIGFVLT